MKYGDSEFQAAFHKLLESPVDRDDFDAIWVKFLCKDLPRFNGNDLKEFLEELAGSVSHEFFTEQHERMLDNIARFCFDFKTGEPNYLPQEITAKALSKMIRTLKTGDVQARVFENISAAAGAKALFKLLDQERDVAFMTFASYLLRAGVIEIGTNGILDISTWDSTKLWPEVAQTIPLANRPYRIDRATELGTQEEPPTLLEAFRASTDSGIVDFNTVAGAWLEAQPPISDSGRTKSEGPTHGIR